MILVPASTYNLDEYVRFRTVRDVFVEFVKGIRISQLEGKDVIRILQPDIRRFSNMKTLVLLDGIPFDDHETILNYDARLYTIYIVILANILLAGSCMMELFRL